jgi:transposase
LTPGNQHDITMFDTLVEGLNANACLADKAYDSKAVIARATTMGMEPVIPHRTCSAPRPLNEALYAIRYLVECCFHDLKSFRRIATRYEKTARNFVAFLSLACSTLWV